jgi:hypothetical protein
MKNLRRVHLWVALSLFFTVSLAAGCASNSTRLASLKANYNAGNWDFVLCKQQAANVYCADDVIKQAGGDPQIADQANLIKARALMNLFIETTSPAAVDATNDPSIHEAVSILKELSTKNFSLNWMNIEMMAGIADYLYILPNYAAAFDAYDYLLNYGDFTSLEASRNQYIRRWLSMWEQLDGGVVPLSDASKKYITNQFKSTYLNLEKKPDRDIGLIKAGILYYAIEENYRQAIQRAMLFRFICAKNPKTQQRYSKEIDDLVDRILKKVPNEKERKELEREYRNFRESWEAAHVGKADNIALSSSGLGPPH